MFGAFADGFLLDDSRWFGTAYTLPGNRFELFFYTEFFAFHQSGWPPSSLSLDGMANRFLQ